MTTTRPTANQSTRDRVNDPRAVILVAEDDAVQRLALARALERQGFEVLEAENGVSAIALACAYLPDLMIFDAVMPQMGGFEAIAAIRSRPGLSTTPAIVVSGLEDVESRVNALAIGADDFVVKPYEHRELIARVDAQLRVVDAWHRQLDTITNDVREAQQRTADQELETWLEQTIASNAFQIVFQPIVEMRTGRVIAQEALARFDDGTPPGEVFNAAKVLDRGVQLEIALAGLALQQAAALPLGVRIHVNVSPATALTSEIRDLVATSARRVVLEITENALFSSSNAELLRSSIPASCLLAADDVGAGYAGMAQLLEYRPEIVKIDRAVVTQIDRDPARQALVAGLVQFAQATRSFVIAEGIERTEEWQQLCELGVDFGQGYLFARPVDLAEAAQMSSCVRHEATPVKPSSIRQLISS